MVSGMGAGWISQNQWKYACAKARVVMLVHIQRGRDVQQHQARDGRRMIQPQPVRDARATVMRQHLVAFVPQRAHQRRHVLGHDALGMRGVARRGRRLSLSP